MAPVRSVSIVNKTGKLKNKGSADKGRTFSQVTWGPKS